MDAYSAKSRSHSYLPWALGVTAVMAIGLILFHHHDTLNWLFENVVRPSARALKRVFTNPFTYLALAAILTVEQLMPAKRTQKILSIGFAQDVVWFFFDIVSQSTLIAAIATFWQAVYREHLSFLTIRAIESYPFWLRMVIAVLVADFVGWLHHYWRHKIWWLWSFHSVHHSQKELNLFTAVRYHVAEYMFTTAIYVIFFGIITMSPHVTIYYSLFYNWYTKMTHANIKADFGILRYVLVSPQSHRIHHSFLPQHRDKNMGIVFSFWDYIFGTQYRKYDEYPDSGIDDETFPHEHEYDWRHLIWTFVKQHLYPFQAIYHFIAGKKKITPATAGSRAARLKIPPSDLSPHIPLELVDALKGTVPIQRQLSASVTALTPHSHSPETSSTPPATVCGKGRD